MLAAQAITRVRELEKEKLTLINITKQQQQDEFKHLKSSMDREVKKSESTLQLKASLQQQIRQRQNESNNEKIQEKETLQYNMRIDQQHWENEERLKN